MAAFAGAASCSGGQKYDPSVYYDYNEKPVHVKCNKKSNKPSNTNRPPTLEKKVTEEKHLKLVLHVNIACIISAIFSLTLPLCTLVLG